MASVMTATGHKMLYLEDINTAGLKTGITSNNAKAYDLTERLKPLYL